MFGVIYFFDDFDCSDSFDKLAGDFIGFLVVDMFYFDL